MPKNSIGVLPALFRSICGFTQLQELILNGLTLGRDTGVDGNSFGFGIAHFSSSIHCMEVVIGRGASMRTSFTEHSWCEVR